MRRTEYNRPKEDVKADKARGFVLPYHYELVSDQVRVSQFKKAILKTCLGRTVLEMGCGTGLLSIISARVAKKVYAVEFDPDVAEIAMANFAASPFRDRISFLLADVNELRIPPEVEVVLCENLSTALVNEPQVKHMNLLARLMPPAVIRIPELVVNLCEGVEADFRFEGVQVRVPYYQFSGVKHPRILTESRAYSAFDFSTETSKWVDASVNMEALSSGCLNALRFSSIVQLCAGVSFYSTDSLMPPVVVPIEKAAKVSLGDRLAVHIRYQCGSDWPDCELKAEVRSHGAGDLALLVRRQAKKPVKPIAG